MHDLIQRAWKEKNLFYILILIPLSWVFSFLSALRRLAYHVGLRTSYRLPVPVVIVGNINMGGSGKTPVVIWLAEQLKLAGYQPGVISRGYGVKGSDPVQVFGDSLPAVVGDEPVLIAKRSHCPVWVSVDRVKAAQSLLAAHPKCDVIISDDGLQHYRLQRDVEIAIVDKQTHAAQRLLPAGPLREPFKRLQTVDAVICHGEKTIASAFQMQLDKQTFYNLADVTLQAVPTDFDNKVVVAIAGIGQPERFFNHLRRLGLDFNSLSFKDHHAFTEQDIQDIECDALIMTEKDAVKCEAFAQAHHWVVSVEANMDATLLPFLLVKLKAAQVFND